VWEEAAESTLTQASAHQGRQTGDGATYSSIGATAARIASMALGGPQVGYRVRAHRLCGVARGPSGAVAHGGGRLGRWSTAPTYSADVGPAVLETELLHKLAVELDHPAGNQAARGARAVSSRAVDLAILAASCLHKMRSSSVPRTAGCTG